MKYIALVLLVGFLVAGIACWASNTGAGNADEWGVDSDKNFVINMSVGSHGKGSMPGWQVILHMLVMIFIIISYYRLRHWQHNKETEIDKNETTPSDYTLWIKGLGKQFDPEEVKQFFHQNGLPTGAPVEIIRTNTPYEISEYVDYVRDHTDLKEKLTYIEEYKKNNDGNVPTYRHLMCCKKEYPPQEELEKEIADVYAKIKEWQEHTEVGVGKDLLIGQLFLTCKNQVDVRAIDEFWGGDWVKRMWDWILGKLGKCSSCCRKEGGKPDFNGRNLVVQIAPEPNDIFYENLGLKWEKRVKRRIITLFTTAVALGISFVLIYFTSSFQTDQYNDYNDKDEDDRTDDDLMLLRINSFLPALGVMVINFVLARSIRSFISYERLETVTEYNAGVALRLTVAQTINTAVIVIAVNYDFEEHWFVPGGLAVDVFYIMMANAFVQPLAYLFDPLYMIRKCKRWTAHKNEYLTQGDANLLFEGPPIDMAKRYSNVMKTFILALVYAPLLPAGLLISFLGIMFEYAIDKYVLLNRHSRPSRMSSDLSDTMTKIVPWAIFFYAMMLFIFSDILESDGAGIAFIWMWICLFHLFLPIDTCRRLCRKSELQDFQNEDDFEKAAVWFFDDYDRSNPVTESEGWEAYSKLLEKSEEGKGLAATFAPMVGKFLDLGSKQGPNTNQLTAGFGNVMQRNIASYAMQHQTMRQVHGRANFNLPGVVQQYRHVRHNPVVSTRSQAQQMIMQQRNAMQGQRFCANYVGYGMSAVRNPYIYRQPVPYYTPQYAYPTQQPQYHQPAQPQYHQPAQPQYAQPAQPQYAQPAQPQYAQPAQPQYAAQPAQPVAYPSAYPAQPNNYVAPQQPQYQPQANTYQYVAPGTNVQPYSGAVQQPAIQPGYQPGFQQAPQQYPAAQYANQPQNYPGFAPVNR